MDKSAVSDEQLRGGHDAACSVVTVTVPGRCMLEDKSEFPCHTLAFDRDAVTMATSARGEIGEHVIVYLDYIGRVEGVILCRTEVGFVLTLTLSPNKREKLDYQLTWLVDRASDEKPDRRHERIVPNSKLCILQWGEDDEQIVELIDISSSGAGLRTSRNIPLGTEVLIGATRGRIIRHFENGMAVEFDSPIPIDIFDAGVKL